MTSNYTLSSFEGKVTFLNFVLESRELNKEFSIVSFPGDEWLKLLTIPGALWCSWPLSHLCLQVSLQFRKGTHRLSMSPHSVIIVAWDIFLVLLKNMDQGKLEHHTADKALWLYHKGKLCDISVSITRAVKKYE